MSELSATNCGCGNSMDNCGCGCGMSSCVWIILLLCCCDERTESGTDGDQDRE